MKVSELVTKLQSLNQDAEVFVDKPFDETGQPRNVLAKATVVAEGIAYYVYYDSVGGFYLSQEPYRHQTANYTPAPYAGVYIGNGEAVVGPLWTKA